MPREIRKPGLASERAEWVRVKAEEYRKKLAAELVDLGLLGETGGQRK
jgi:hypothetical protein